MERNEEDGAKLPGGVSLSKCNFQLRQIFGQLPFRPDDEAHPGLAFYVSHAAAVGPMYDDPDGSKQAAWGRTNFMNAMAEKSLSGALASGALPVWAEMPKGWQEMDADVLFSGNQNEWHRTLCTGRYFTFARPGGREPRAYDARLAVKESDWKRWLEAMVAEWRGKAPSRRGRTPGTGHHIADAPLVEKMVADMEADPNLRPYSAAQKYAPVAAGGGQEKKKAERLVIRYREHDKSRS